MSEGSFPRREVFQLGYESLEIKFGTPTSFFEKTLHHTSRLRRATPSQKTSSGGSHTPNLRAGLCVHTSSATTAPSQPPPIGKLTTDRTLREEKEVTKGNTIPWSHLRGDVDTALTEGSVQT